METKHTEYTKAEEALGLGFILLTHTTLNTLELLFYSRLLAQYKPTSINKLTASFWEDFIISVWFCEVIGLIMLEVCVRAQARTHSLEEPCAIDCEWPYATAILIVWEEGQGNEAHLYNKEK